MKYIIVVLSIVLFFSFSFAGDDPKPGELSALTFTKGDTAYIKIYRSISYMDEMAVWNDLIVLEHMPEIKKIDVHVIDNYGGDAFAGFALHDLFVEAQKRFETSVHATGVVASAAVLIYMAFDDRSASDNSFFMVHELKSTQSQDMTSSDVRKLNDLFERLQDRYISIIVKNTVGAQEELTVDQWAEKLEASTWFSTEEARKNGVVNK